MFHQGDLTSGIGKAVQEQKLVACFIRAEGDAASEIWEHEWLGSRHSSSGDSTLGELVATKAVILRLESGSQEANFLNAFTQITAVPTLVVIHNGQVLEKLEGASLEKEEFVSRILKIVGLEGGQTTTSSNSAASSSGSTSTASSHAQSSISQTTTQASNTASAQAGVASPPTSTHSNAATSSSNTTAPSSDRVARQFAEKLQREAAEKSARAASSSARQNEADQAPVAGSSSTAKGENAARKDWLQQQKRKKDESKREKERILAQIEADRQNRRLRAEEQRNLSNATSNDAPSSALPTGTDAANKRRAGGAASHCSLQIRLFDGSSIKNRFESSTTLATGVRSWIKEATAGADAEAKIGDMPYTFRQILAPQPNRVIEVSEEHQSLLDLDLTPSATLVLVPVQTYTDAYAGGGGIVGTATNVAYGVVGGAWSVASSLLSYVPGLGTVQTSSPPPGTSDALSGSSGSAAGPARVNVKTLADQRAEAKPVNRDTEFYNGNSSAFEGRKDDE